MSVTGKTVNRIFVHNINGRLIRAVQIGFSVTAWCTWASRSAFDYLMVANEQGKVFVFEAFYVNIGKSLHRCYETVIYRSYVIEWGVGVIVLGNGHVVFLPFVID
jgi:hypothetical protein